MKHNFSSQNPAGGAHVQELIKAHTLRVRKVVHFTKRSRVFGGSTDLKTCENGLHKPFSKRTLRWGEEINSNHPKMSVMTRYGRGI